MSELLHLALRPAPVRIELNGRGFVIPALDAAGWLGALSSPPVELAVVPGLLGEDEAELIGDWAEAGTVTRLDLQRAAYAAIAQAGGRDWWEVVKLADAASEPRLLGELTLHGVEPAAMPLARWCAAAYAMMIRGLDEKGLMKFHAKLMLAPVIPGLEIEEVETDAEEVMRMLRAMPGVSISE